MANRPEVRYINEYVSGTMAYQPARKPSRKLYTVQLPKPRKKKQNLILLDPVAVVGIVVAVVLMVMLLSGAVQLFKTQQETAELRSYVAQLQEKNAQLRDTYASGYDPEEIRTIAQTMGMVPKADVETIAVMVTVPEPEVKLTRSEEIRLFLEGMFA